MNAELINNWNDRVSDEDTVYVLGDVAMGKINDTLPLAKSLKGFKFLLPGNHDRCWFADKKHQKWIDAYEEVGFAIIANNFEDGGIIHDWFDIDTGAQVVADLCHFPFTGDSGGEDRHTAYRPTDNGQWLIHGHVHDAWRVNGKMINIGVDVWDYTPVSLNQIKEIIDG